MKKQMISQEELLDLIEKINCIKNSGDLSDKNIKKQYDFFTAKLLKSLDYLIQARLCKYKKFANYDDLYQDAKMAVMMAISSFKPNKGNVFWWIDMYLKTQISREASRHSVITIPLKKLKDMIPMSVPFPKKRDDDFCSVDFFIENIERAEVLNNILACFPELSRRVLELSIIYEMPDSCICKELNISKGKLRKIINDDREVFNKKIDEYKTCQ